MRMKITFDLSAFLFEQLRNGADVRICDFGEESVVRVQGNRHDIFPLSDSASLHGNGSTIHP